MDFEDREDEQDCGQRSAECSCIDCEAAEPQDHGTQCRNGCAPRATENVGFRERIAQQDLHEHAGNGQQAANGKRGKRARQAQLRDQ